MRVATPLNIAVGADLVSHRRGRDSVEHSARSDAASDDTLYGIADRREDLLASFRLVYDAYVRSGLTAPNPFRLRLTPYHLLPTTEVFTARRAGSIVCTMTLVRDGRLGLPMESLFPEQVAWRRAEGITVAEVSCLADSHHDLKASFPVVFRLMVLLAQCARTRGVDELLITVHPHHAGFYERFCAFRPIGEARVYPAVRDKPAVPLAVDMANLRENNPRVHGRFFGKPYSSESLRYRALPDAVRGEMRLLLEAIQELERAGSGAHGPFPADLPEVDEEVAFAA